MGLRRQSFVLPEQMLPFFSDGKTIEFYAFFLDDMYQKKPQFW